MILEMFWSPLSLAISSRLIFFIKFPLVYFFGWITILNKLAENAHYIISLKGILVESL